MQAPNLALGAHLDGYAGIPSFMRQPVTRDLSGVDVAIVGIPFDGGAVSNRSGARMGPRKVREASLIMWGYHPQFQVTPHQELRIVDYGDVAVQPTNIDETMASISATAREILGQGPKLLALGGDHSITLPLLRAHAAKFGPLAVIQFDSHVDTEAGGFQHGTPFRFAIEEGLIDTQAFVQVGIRGPLGNADDVEDARRLGAQVLTIDACFEMGIPVVIQRIREVIGERLAYVSLDIDAVDPAYAPATGTPEVGGFSSYQIVKLVQGLRGLNLVGFDLVEVCPPYDCGDITSILAANLAFQFLGLLALHKRGHDDR